MKFDERGGPRCFPAVPRALPAVAIMGPNIGTARYTDSIDGTRVAEVALAAAAIKVPLECFSSKMKGYFNDRAIETGGAHFD